MQNSEIPLVFTAMTVAQFKTFKKAMAVLLRAGVSYENAIMLLLEAQQEKWRESCRIPARVVKHGS